MRIQGRMVGVVASVVAIAACVGEGRAGAALKESEEAITGHHAEAIRYAPEAFKAVMAVYDSARKSFEAGDYRDAVAGARAATEQARELPAAITSGRRMVTEQWNIVSGELTDLLAATEERLTALERSRRLPAGVTRADVAAVKEELPVVKKTLTDVTRTFESGRLAEAVHAGSQLRTQLVAVAGRVGVSLEKEGGGA